MAGNLTELFKAADAFMEAAVLGRSWSTPLMLMAQAIGATGGILSRLTPDRKTFAQVTANLNEPLNLMYSGKLGYMPPGQHMVRQFETQFFTDNDDPAHEARKRQPFHQDFLHKFGLDWRCAAMLEDTEDALRISFYRTESQGPFDLSEVSPLNSLFPLFRASALVSHTVLDQQARLAAAPFEARGEKVYYLGSQGKVLHQNDAAGNTAAIKVVRDRLATEDAGSQRLLDAAIHLASGPQHQPAITVISDDRGPSRAMSESW